MEENSKKIVQRTFPETVGISHKMVQNSYFNYRGKVNIRTILFKINRQLYKTIS